MFLFSPILYELKLYVLHVWNFLADWNFFQPIRAEKKAAMVLVSIEKKIAFTRLLRLLLSHWNSTTTDDDDHSKMFQSTAD